jgi:hypothetical protein
VDPLEADIEEAKRRAAHYWVQDGLQEALSGSVFVLVGAFLVAQSLAPKVNPYRAFFAFGFPVLIIGLGLLLRGVVMRLKDRYVHPRTGYVSFQRATRRSGWVGGVLGGIVAALVVVAARNPAVVSWLPALQGLATGAALLYVGLKLGVARFSVEAVLTALPGLGLAFLDLDENLASGVLFAWTGLAMALGGLLAFRSYLRQAPPGEQA